MPEDPAALVPDIRAASRELVRRWGFLSRSVAGTDLSASAVHAIIEVGGADGLSARDLSARLGLEKSTVSRLVRALVERGEIAEAPAADDARIKRLRLTAQGRATLAGVDGVADAQVAAALARLDPPARRTVRDGLTAYAGALRPQGAAPGAALAPEIVRGYVPGLIGRAVELMATRTLSHYALGAAFETRVARDMAEFVPRADRAPNGIWHARAGGRIVGTITIDGEDLNTGGIEGLAHLRWFVVDPAHRGTGTGRALLQAALAHCDATGARETQLWTLRGLVSARRLYERNGFRLAEEYVGDQWGGAVTEQRFVRPGNRP